MWVVSVMSPTKSRISMLKCECPNLLGNILAITGGVRSGQKDRNKKTRIPIVTTKERETYIQCWKFMLFGVDLFCAAAAAAAAAVVASCCCAEMVAPSVGRGSDQTAGVFVPSRTESLRFEGHPCQCPTPREGLTIPIRSAPLETRCGQTCP